MSPIQRISVVVAVLLAFALALFSLRGCRRDEQSDAGSGPATAPPEAPQPSAADSSRKGQIYFHRDLGLAKIIPGEGLITRLPDPVAADQQNYQLHSDRLSPDATRIAFGQAVIRKIDDHYGAFPPDPIFVRRIDKSDPAELLLRIAGAEIRNFLWSPDAARLAVVAWDQEHGNRNWIFDVVSKQVEEAHLPKYNVDGKEHTMTIAA